MSKPAFSALTADNIVAFLADIFQRRGGEEYLGESVTMAEHMLQSAHYAEEAGEAEVVIVAALLHDVGHFTSEFGTFSMDDTKDKYHEAAGATVLEPFFPALVTDCVRFHVAAKRYLCAAEPDYFNRLSPASVHSMQLQGGAMSADEVTDFRQQPNLKEIVKVRHYDDAGKKAGMQTRPFSYYAPMVQRIVDSQCAVTHGCSDLNSR